MRAGFLLLILLIIGIFLIGCSENVTNEDIEKELETLSDEDLNKLAEVNDEDSNALAGMSHSIGLKKKLSSHGRLSDLANFVKLKRDRAKEQLNEVALVEICFDNQDNDGDGIIDCVDDSCWGNIDACHNIFCGYRADISSLSDCPVVGLNGYWSSSVEGDKCVVKAPDISICSELDFLEVEENTAVYFGPSPTEGTITSCFDNQDNDNDGLIDCADSDCIGQGGIQYGKPLCESNEGLCSYGFDNDANGDVDCADYNCDSKFAGNIPSFGNVFCQNAETQCGDNFDNDDDGLVDCSDPTCKLHVSCLSENNKKYGAIGKSADDDGPCDNRNTFIDRFALSGTNPSWHGDNWWDICNGYDGCKTPPEEGCWFLVIEHDSPFTNENAWKKSCYGEYFDSSKYVEPSCGPSGYDKSKGGMIVAGVAGVTAVGASVQYLTGAGGSNAYDCLLDYNYKAENALICADGGYWHECNLDLINTKIIVNGGWKVCSVDISTGKTVWVPWTKIWGFN